MPDSNVDNAERALDPEPQVPDQGQPNQTPTVEAGAEGTLGLAASRTEGQQQSPEESKPEWLDSKFGSVEEQAQAYNELEGRMGQQSNELGELRRENEKVVQLNEQLYNQVNQLISRMDQGNAMQPQPTAPQPSETPAYEAILNDPNQAIELTSDPAKMISVVKDVVQHEVSKAIQANNPVIDALVNQTISNSDILEEQSILRDPNLGELYQSRKADVDRLMKERQNQGAAIKRREAFQEVVFGDQELLRKLSARPDASQPAPTEPPPDRNTATGVDNSVNTAGGVDKSANLSPTDHASDGMQAWRNVVTAGQAPDNPWFRFRSPIKGA